MATEVKVPPFPESVEEGALMAWHKQAGDPVTQDEKIADIETDKIVLEVMAPVPGVLGDVLVKEGASVKPGQVLAHIEKGAAGATPPAAKPEKEKAEEKAPAQAPKAAAEKPTPAPAPKTPAPAAKKEEPAAPNPPAKSDEPVRLSPAVRRMVANHQIDPTLLKGTGRGGLVTKADVLAYLEEADAEPTEPKAASPAPSQAAESGAPAPTADAPTAKDDDRPVQRTPMSRLRLRIAERLVQAQQTAAILTTFNEVNLQAVMDLRSRHRDAFEKKYGVKLGFMSFFARACVEAINEFPVVNASLDGKDVVYHSYVDIGMAVSTERGLVVPVLRDVDRRSFADIEKGIVQLAERARDGKLEMNELTGGTFTITNGGVFGSLLSTPILNPPQSAILGMHTIQDRPVAENGQVVIRPMMYLALSYDHRLVDGREAVQFLVTVKKCLEDPARLLLQV